MLMAEALILMAEDKGIAIIGSKSLGFELPDTLPAVSYEDYQTIVVKPGIEDRRYTIVLAHELGHFIKKAFYTALSPLQTRGRCEAKANAWMIEELCPVGRLRDALEDGCRTYWELAEELDISEDLARKALEYYQRKRML